MLGGLPCPLFRGEQRSGGHFLPLPLVSACGTNMGNANFKQLQMGEGTSGLVLHMFFFLAGLNLKWSGRIVREAPRPYALTGAAVYTGCSLPRCLLMENKGE